MDYESEDSRSKGCWDPVPALQPFYEKWTSAVATPDFLVDDVWCGMVGGIGFGATASEELSAFWTKTLKEVYKGDEGRKKVRMAVICLLSRDGLLLRLRDIKCPVHWLQVSPSPNWYIVVAAKIAVDRAPRTLHLAKQCQQSRSNSSPRPLTPSLSWSREEPII
jgi:microsomal epoxide hydrolase